MSPLPNVAFRTYKKSSFSSFLPPIFSQVQPKTAALQTPKQQGPEGRTKPAGIRLHCLTLLSGPGRKLDLFQPFSAKSSPKRQHYKCQNSRALKDEPSLLSELARNLSLFHPKKSTSLPAHSIQVQPKMAALQMPKHHGTQEQTKPAGTRLHCL